MGRQLATVLREYLVNHNASEGGFVLRTIKIFSNKDFYVPPLKSGCLMAIITLKHWELDK